MKTGRKPLVKIPPIIIAWATLMTAGRWYPSPLTKDSSGIVRKRHWRFPCFVPLAVSKRPFRDFFSKVLKRQRESPLDVSQAGGKWYPTLVIFALACITRPSRVLHAYVRLPCPRFSLPSFYIIFLVHASTSRGFVKARRNGSPRSYLRISWAKKNPNVF